MTFQHSTYFSATMLGNTPHAFAAVDNQADTLTQSQMLKDPDRSLFIASQHAEVAGLQKMDVFEVLPISAKPALAKILSSIWSYRRKQSPVGTILKHKSRLCVDGSQQLHGRDFWETYAPVISWSTVHLMLLLTSILNLKSRQVDYMHTKHFIKLKRNLYGCHQATRNWFTYLTKGLLAHGFKQSVHEPCLYLHHDCIMIVYTDDCLIFAKDDSTIDTSIKALSETYLLEDQGTVSDYLGICITKNATTKEISMTQPGLIDSILQDLHLEASSHTKDTPAMGILHPDRNGHPREDKWNYRSLIGKLTYLAQNTRPDISFAVHQCA